MGENDNFHAGANSTKDKPLEAIRGAAAVNVLIWHTMLGFFPEYSGNFAKFSTDGAAGQPWYSLIYGTFAVVIFFVLSGYVLTRSYFLSSNNMIIVRGALKRWPRLAGPVLASVLFSWLLLTAHLYYYNEAASLTGSPWLSGHLFSSAPIFSPAILDAFAQGTLFTFIKENSSYFNTSLWTMRWEFFGSFLVFGLSFLIVRFQGALRITALAVAVFFCHRWMAQELRPFVAGMVIAALLPRQRIGVPAFATIILLFVAIYLGGYMGRPIGAFSPLYSIFGNNYSTIGYVQIGAASLAILAVETSPKFRRYLSAPWASHLGRLSFPLYLVHIPVLCSVGCLTLVSLDGLLPLAATRVTAAFVTLAAAFAVAVPLMHFNDWWVKWLNGLFDRVFNSYQDRRMATPYSKDTSTPPAISSK